MVIKLGDKGGRGVSGGKNKEGSRKAYLVTAGAVRSIAVVEPA